MSSGSLEIGPPTLGLIGHSVLPFRLSVLGRRRNMLNQLHLQLLSAAVETKSLGGASLMRKL